jgi:hypothetical protein
MGCVSCGEGQTSRRKESHSEESDGEDGTGKGGEEGCASQEDGGEGEEGDGEEDGPDSHTGRNGNRRSVDRWRPDLIRAIAGKPGRAVECDQWADAFPVRVGSFKSAEE